MSVTGIIDRFECSLAKCELADAQVKVLRNKPIYGSDSLYARSIDARTKYGNPVEIRHGRLRAYLPPARVIFHSEACPLTFREIRDFLSNLTTIDQAIVRYIEIACDIQPHEVGSITRHIFTPCRRFRELRDEEGRRTNYFGSPLSVRQLRVYQKATDVTRIEIVLRRHALAKLGLRRIESLRDLRQVTQLDFFQIRTVNRRRLRAVLAPYMED